MTTFFCVDGLYFWLFLQIESDKAIANVLGGFQFDRVHRRFEKQGMFLSSKKTLEFLDRSQWPEYIPCESIVCLNRKVKNDLILV
jgi:hypothetical protein